MAIRRVAVDFASRGRLFVDLLVQVISIDWLIGAYHAWGLGLGLELQTVGLVRSSSRMMLSVIIVDNADSVSRLLRAVYSGVDGWFRKYNSFSTVYKCRPRLAGLAKSCQTAVCVNVLNDTNILRQVLLYTSRRGQACRASR